MSSTDESIFNVANMDANGLKVLNERLPEMAKSLTTSSVVPLAYWKSRFPSLSTQKVSGLAELFSGLATYSNRIGHHRSKIERDHTGGLQQIPLDHWEAELVVGATQFLLAYALRLRSTDLLNLKPIEEANSEST
jgi:hypothetical protein